MRKRDNPEQIPIEAPDPGLRPAGGNRNSIQQEKGIHATKWPPEPGSPQTGLRLRGGRAQWARPAGQSCQAPEHQTPAPDNQNRLSYQLPPIAIMEVEIQEAPAPAGASYVNLAINPIGGRNQVRNLPQSVAPAAAKGTKIPAKYQGKLHRMNTLHTYDGGGGCLLQLPIRPYPHPFVACIKHQ
jgi:hypothetical protein